MNLHLQRITPKSRTFDTLGNLFIEDIFAGVTLEDCFRETKIPKLTRIPAGVYQLKLRTYGTHHEKALAKYGDWHKGMIELTDVNNFTDILIHVGNGAKDTDGCLLIGNGFLYRDSGESVLLESTVCYQRVYPILRDGIIAGPTNLVITDG